MKLVDSKPGDQFIQARTDDKGEIIKLRFMVVGYDGWRVMYRRFMEGKLGGFAVGIGCGPYFNLVKALDEVCQPSHMIVLNLNDGELESHFKEDDIQVIPVEDDVDLLKARIAELEKLNSRSCNNCGRSINCRGRYGLQENVNSTDVQTRCGQWQAKTAIW